MAHVLFAADGMSGACYEVGLNCVELPPGSVEVSDAAWADFMASPGMRRWDGTQVRAQAPTPPVPPDISDRQFARGLWGDGIISYSDFLGFIGPGTIPGPIQTIVNQLADDDTGQPTPRKDAVGFLTGSKLYAFSHPLVEFFRQALAASDPKWTPDYLRAQWLTWAKL